MTAPLLEVTDLSVEFPLRRQRLQALDRISFSLEAGEVLQAQYLLPMLLSLRFARISMSSFSLSASAGSAGFSMISISSWSCVLSVITGASAPA